MAQLNFTVETIPMHRIVSPSILYFGTPVVLISTVNENGSFNLAPISSAFWLGWRCIIGIGASSKTTENLFRTKQCVLALPSVNEVDAVNKLALKTGSDPVPEGKKRKGYVHEAHKFETAGLTPFISSIVNAPCVTECPVNMEAELVAAHAVGLENASDVPRILTIELKISAVHADESIIMDGYANRIDPEKWRPLIMSFQRFYGLSEEVQTSVLASISEDLYRRS